jgi:hypothetical protein
VVGSKFPVAIDQHKAIDKLIGEAKRQIWQNGGCPRDPQVLITALRCWLDGATSLTNITSLTKIQELIDIGYSDLFGSWWRETWFEVIGDFAYIARDDLKYDLALASGTIERIENVLEAAGVRFEQYLNSSGAVHYALPGFKPKIRQERLMELEIGSLQFRSLDLTSFNINFLHSAGIDRIADFWETSGALLRSDLTGFAQMQRLGDNEISWAERIAEVLCDWRATVMLTQYAPII